ncbi:pilus motility taxis protein HmpF [Synechocystis sp. PCC 7509]|uniref:pilus motility taxis protein HmpF n=1 Tax=Synechocystis sp. PCC 7509 TaxID=927677 RepID=UPI0002ABDFE9|nr:pilus motility taxis protein HmpF [Synechocystis sp. PCC 7509]
MLYLAEVQKQKSKTGFMGAAKAELKLLAYQRPDQSWAAVQGEEAIAAEEANNFNTGVLVLADLNANRQAQQIREAGRPLVGILQSFSRQMEKAKGQEEEIEQWKQSLTYQSEELNRRNTELEGRLEELEHIEEDFHRLEMQKQAFATAQNNVEQLQAEVDRSRGELEGAWEHLRGEQLRLVDKQGSLLDDETKQQLQQLLDLIVSSIAPKAALKEQLNFSTETVNNQQNILSYHWQQLEQQRANAQQQQEEVDSLKSMLTNRQTQWDTEQKAMETALVELQVQKLALNHKQDEAQILGIKLRKQEEIYHQIHCLVDPEAVDSAQNLDLEALENMSLDQLQQVIQDLQRDLEGASGFVYDQEEELRLLQQNIDDLQAKVSHGHESDRSRLQTELADERDTYEFLDQTLVGQRQNLQERKQVLNQHQSVLWRRQGITPANRQEDYKIDLSPILVQVDAIKQQQAKELQKIEQEITQLGADIQPLQENVSRQINTQQTVRQQLQELAENLYSQLSLTAQCWGKVHLYQEMLQPVQDNLDELKHKLGAIAVNIEQLEISSEQIQVEQIREKLSNLAVR